MEGLPAIEEIEFDLGEIKLRGLACGDNRADLILCLHGWLDNAASFSPLMTKFTGKLF